MRACPIRDQFVTIALPSTRISIRTRPLGLLLLRTLSPFIYHYSAASCIGISGLIRRALWSVGQPLCLVLIVERPGGNDELWGGVVEAGCD